MLWDFEIITSPVAMIDIAVSTKRKKKKPNERKMP